MAENLVVIKRDGTQTNPAMGQTQAERYLVNVVHNSLHSNLKQALNQAFDGNGKASGTYRFNNNLILHASSGKIGTNKCVSLFYYELGLSLIHI